ncbi:MAG TPA: glycerol-3-phosphate 1-O-acyltransferase PlsY [Hyphomicrobiaceae bacterium]|nr:glycerol-3-phosphate 1-O-acyltransferase PlsY [Hyphomicrobiaceae bacterium]
MGSIYLWPLLVTFLIGYVFGSIPFGLILTRAAGLGDVRKIGSGNIGATNVLRTGNKGLAAATLVLDALKGTAAILATLLALRWFLLGGMPSDAARVALAQSAYWAAGLGAIAGHMFPVWLGFRGGKGVATFIGVLIGIYWPAAAAFAVVWLIVAAMTRYSSLSALIATVAVTGLVIATSTSPVPIAASVLMAILIFWKHRENIRRLLNGEESRIGAKA